MFFLYREDEKKNEENLQRILDFCGFIEHGNVPSFFVISWGVKIFSITMNLKNGLRELMKVSKSER